MVKQFSPGGHKDLQAAFFLEALGTICYLAFSSFLRLPAFLGSWPAPLHPLLLSSHLLLSLCFHCLIAFSEPPASPSDLSMWLVLPYSMVAWSRQEFLHGSSELLDECSQRARQNLQGHLWANLRSHIASFRHAPLVEVVRGLPRLKGRDHMPWWKEFQRICSYILKNGLDFPNRSFFR